MSEKYEGTIESREYIPSGDSGLTVTGRWMNKRTGKFINVRNSVMDGNKMIIITDQGQLDMTEFSRDYIQASDEIYNDKGTVIGQQPAAEDYVESDDWRLIQETLYGNGEKEYHTAPAPAYADTPVQKDDTVLTNEKIISKVFDKLEDLPKLTVNIEWDNFPSQQLHTLIDFLDVSMDDISKYILKKYASNKEIAKAISEEITNKLNEQS